MSDEMSAQLPEPLAMLGFDGSKPLFDVHPDFTLDDLIASLVANKRQELRALPLELDKGGLSVTLNLLVSTITQVYTPLTSLGGTVEGYYESPEWYFEAWITSGEFAPAQPPSVRCFLETTGNFAAGQLQFIGEPPAINWR